MATKVLKSLIRRAVERAGYHVAAKSFWGYDSLADFKVLYANETSPTVIDVGGFIGGFAADIVRILPRARVHSFEPVEQNFRQLVANTQHLPGVTPVNVALGSGPGEFDFQVNAAPATSSFLLPASTGVLSAPPGSLDRRDTRKIRVMRLDDYASANGIEQIDLLKTDTQGYELEVLRGAERMFSTGRIRAVHCEVFFQEIYKGQSYFHEIHAFLLRHRMSLSGLYDVGRSPTHELLWADAFDLNSACA